MTSLTWAQVLSWRTGRSYLSTPSEKGLVDVARRLCGVQAQLMSSAELALCLRVAATTRGDVQRALWRDRSLVKTWTARGTLHLVPADDLPLWFAAMQARGAYWAKPSWERYHGVTAEEMDLILNGLDEALEGQCLTREELAERLARVTKRKELARRVMGSWGATIKPAAYRGKLCFGPNRGRNITFVSPRDWIGAWDDVDGDEALARLAERYVGTYGPSTRDDFARWMGVEPRIARRAFQLAAPHLVGVDVEGTPAWLTLAGEKEVPKRLRRAATVRLLPAFDPYVVGVLKHLERLLPDSSLRPRVSRAAGWISPTIVVEGRIVGTWRHERRGRKVEITLDPFETIDEQVGTALRRRARSMVDLLQQVPEDDRGDGDGATSDVPV